MSNFLKKTLTVLLVTVLMAVSVCGCGASSAGGGGGKGKILLALHDDTDTFLNVLVAAMQERAQKDGLNIDIVYAANSTDTQKQQLEDAAKAGYSAIICRL